MVEIGLERFAREQRHARTVKGHVGVLMNRASVDRELRLASAVIQEALPNSLRCIFAPQHGWWGEQQANMIETPHNHAPMFPVPVYSLYADARRPTREMLSGVDHLIIDLQDVGVRVYTFVWTMLYCLEACAEADVEVIVLDRPNPLGGEVVEGPRLEASCRSFVGEAEIPMRHGLTIGELARWLVVNHSIDVALSVIPLGGWRRNLLFDQLDRSWLPPSPNLPTFQSALVYAGQVLLEGVNLSEGRGTTTPFQFVGAPFVDPVSLCDACRKLDLPGVRFLPARFTPTFDKWAGESCGGVSIHVTNPQRLRSYPMTLQLLALARGMYPDAVAWNPPPYEYETEKPPIDIISGSAKLRQQLSQRNVDELSFVDEESWRNDTAHARMYS